MLGWSRPWRTRISPKTLSSSPLTFFFGMAFKATSRVTSCDTESAEPARLGGKDGRLGEGEAAGEVEGAPVWRRWTSHVARWVTESVKSDKRHTRRWTDHDFSKRASPEHLLDLIILLLVRRWRLGQNLLGNERKHFRGCCGGGSAHCKGAKCTYLRAKDAKPFLPATGIKIRR
jgi:hypothetical protein